MMDLAKQISCIAEKMETVAKKIELNEYLSEQVSKSGGISLLTSSGWRVVLVYGKVYFTSCMDDLDGLKEKLVSRGYSAVVLKDKDAVDDFVFAVRKRHVGDRDFEE